MTAAAHAEPCTSNVGPALDRVTAFEEATLAQDWDALVALLPNMDGSDVEDAVQVLGTIARGFSSCEVIYHRIFEPNVHKRAVAFYQSGELLPLLLRMDVIVLRGEPFIVEWQFTTEWGDVVEWVE
jgi:hypothetical protein